MTTQNPVRSSSPSARVWLFRALAAIGLPAAMIIGLEGGLRLAGYGRPAGFLIPDDQPGYYRSNPEFTSLFMPAGFDLRPLNFRVALRKPPNTARIVVLGESAAEGVPAPAFAFAPQLRAQLRARYPGRNIEVINTGIVAINSHVIYRIARDLAEFAPDLYVVYMGNNEVVGPYGPGCTYLSEMPPLWVIRWSVFVRSTRTGQLLGALFGRLARHPATAEWEGMSTFVDSAVTGDDPRLEAVCRNFEKNLTDIVRVAAGAGAKTLLCTVVSNLKDFSPLLSRHRTGLSGADLAAWQRAFDRGRIEWQLGETGPARADLREARRLDPGYADTLYLLGSLDLAEGEVAAARRLLLDAEHRDALRFRPDSRINEIIRRVARREPTVTLLDAALLMGSDPASSGVPAGREILFEHVHLNWDGNNRLARLMAEPAAGILFGGEPGRGEWLDSGGCAAALGYSAHERFSVLGRLSAIVVAPPFTNQLTYGEDEARLARDLAQAKRESGAPETLRQARALVAAATAADPGNSDLARIGEAIADDSGDIPGALAEAQRARTLQPASVTLAADVALKLSQLGRLAEAEQLLRQVARESPPRDLALMAPAFADLFTRTRRFAEGRSYFDELVARRPADASLRVLRGRLAWLAGDHAAAESEFRAILDQEPANQPAAEALIALLGQTGRTAAAANAILSVAEHQPRNQANNLRAAILGEERHDDSGASRYLLAAERSGPVTSGVELHLARKFFDRHELDEGLAHLAEARRISWYEGDPAATKSIDEVIARIRAQMR